MASVKQIIKEQQYEFQFYNQLEKPKWLPHLKQDGFFEETTYPSSPENGTVVQQAEWLPLRYLEKISGLVDQEGSMAIQEVISGFEDAVIAGRVKVDDYSIGLLVRIWAKLPGYVFSWRNRKLLETYNNYARREFKFYESDITQSLIARYVGDGSKEALIYVVGYSYDFHQEDVFWEGEEVPFVRYYPNLSQVHLGVINHRNKEIIEAGGNELLSKLLLVLGRLEEKSPMEIMGIPSIEPSEQSEMRAYNWETEIVNFIRDGIENLSDEGRAIFVRSLLEGKSHVGWRLALNAVNVHFEQLQGLFWDWIKKNPLQVLFPLHELYLLIRDKLAGLTLDQFNKLSQWLQLIEFENRHLDEAEIETAKKEQVRRYLSALVPVDENIQKELQELRGKYEDENSYVSSHPEFDDYTTVSYGFDLPEMPVGFKDLPVKQMVEFLSKHATLDRFNDIPRGLGTLMNTYIIDDPQKFIDGLDELSKMPSVYLNQVIGSFALVLKNGFKTYYLRLLSVFAGWVAHYQQKADPEKTLANYELGEFLLVLSERPDHVGLDQQKLEAVGEVVVNLLESEDNRGNESIKDDLVSHMLNIRMV